ncbi:MAG TPA: oligopeptide/dipeptide ABC transporter ATP-binding protein [Chloroflexota bacterium]
MGDVDLVIKNPQHPDSRLLISSIPTPDVDDRWDDDDQSLATRVEAGRPMMRGCRFADRCPAVMPMCSGTVPPLYRTMIGARRRASSTGTCPPSAAPTWIKC